MNNTIKLDEPKFIRYQEFCFYCFGNCELCKIRFMCLSGHIEIVGGINYAAVDELLELEAFGDLKGRIITMGEVDYDGKFHRSYYRGKQINREVFTACGLLYINKSKMVCCEKRPKPIHHIKNW